MIDRGMPFHELAGNLHVHSVYSDGTGLHREVVEAAGRAGLDFVIVTDHNVWVDGLEGVHGGVVLLVGEEVHHVYRQPEASHLLVYGAEAELATGPGGARQAEVSEARRKGLPSGAAGPGSEAAAIAFGRAVSLVWLGLFITAMVNVWSSNRSRSSFTRPALRVPARTPPRF